MFIHMGSFCLLMDIPNCANTPISLVRKEPGILMAACAAATEVPQPFLVKLSLQA